MKHVIIIPSFNPNEELISLVNKLTYKGECKIVVVDDGSHVEFANILNKLNDYEDVVILRHKTNIGKGACLKTAFYYCLETFKDCVGVIVCDDNGKYDPKDIIKVAKELHLNPNSLILGTRSFEKGNNLNYFLKLLYNLNISDPQTGLRGIPMNDLKWLIKAKGKRYDYEVNMLIQYKKRNIEIIQIPINKTSKTLSHHYKKVQDTIGIIFLLIFNLFPYLAAAFLSIIIDVALFFISNTFLFSKMEIAKRLFISTVFSRTLSSLCNFSMNRRFFIKSKKQFKNHLFKYYILWFFQMMISYMFVYLISINFNINASIIKTIVDLILAVISYQFQLRFVFKDENNLKKPYGNLFYFCRWFLRLFNRKLKVIGDLPDKPTVFIGHHQNLKGAINILMWLEIPVHLWILDVFCEKVSCFNQFYGYTLTKRLKFKKPFAYIASKILSMFVPRLSKSINSIPVSRNSMKVIENTMKPSCEILRSGGNILLFPDIDYSNKDTSMGKMYTGFVSLDKFYYEKNKKHVAFVPIKVDKSKGIINIGDPSIICDEEKFSQGKKRVCTELMEKLNLL